MGMFVLIFLLLKGVLLADRRSIRTGLCYLLVDRDSAIGIATCYGLDGLGIESRWWRDPDRPWGPPRLLYNGCRVFPGS
jgi:hypothetical protein